MNHYYRTIFIIYYYYLCIDKSIDFRLIRKLHDVVNTSMCHSIQVGEDTLRCQNPAAEITVCTEAPIVTPT